MKNLYLENKEIERLIDWMLNKTLIVVSVNGYQIKDYDYNQIVRDYRKNTKHIQCLLNRLSDNISFLKTRNDLKKMN